jgi:hypothetical protein
VKRQARNREAHGSNLLASCEVADRIGVGDQRRRAGVNRLIDIHLDSKPAPFVSLQYQVSRDSIQIRRKRCALRIETGRILRESEEDVLRHIFGRFSRRQHLAAEAKNSRLMPAEERRKRFAIAIGESPDESCVAQFLVVGDHVIG